MTRTTRFSPLDLPLLIFLLAALLGILPAYNRGGAILPALALSGCLALYGLVSRAGRRNAVFVLIVRAVTLLAGLVAVFFITQSGHYDTLEKVDPLARISQGIARFFPALGLWSPVANSLAALLEGLLFLAVGWWFEEKKHGWRIAAGVCAGLIALALLLSQSRGAWLALVVAGLIWLALSVRPLCWLAMVGAVALLGLVILVVATGDILVLDRIPVINRTLAPLLIRPDRLEVYRGSLYLLQDVPFTGIGLGPQFAMNYSRYVLLIQVPYLTYSHNFYLETWLQSGLLGLWALIWLVAALVTCSVALRREKSGKLAESAWVGLAAIFIHGLTDARQYSDLWCWLPLFVLAGLVSAAWLRQGMAVRFGWVPAAIAAAAVTVLLVGIWPLPGAWNTNLGSLRQARAELAGWEHPQQRLANLQSAQDSFERSLAVAPAQRSANLRLGLIEIDQEQFAAAVAHLEAAHRADPANPTAVKALGLAYTWTGQVQQAAKLLSSVAGMDQELNTWGFWRVSQGKTELGRYAYQVSLLINPAQPQVEQALRQLAHP